MKARKAFNEEKLASLRKFDDVMKEKYGEENSSERQEFDAKAKAWYANALGLRFR